MCLLYLNMSAVSLFSVNFNVLNTTNYFPVKIPFAQQKNIKITNKWNANLGLKSQFASPF